MNEEGLFLSISQFGGCLWLISLEPEFCIIFWSHNSSSSSSDSISALFWALSDSQLQEISSFHPAGSFESFFFSFYDIFCFVICFVLFSSYYRTFGHHFRLLVVCHQCVGCGNWNFPLFGNVFFCSNISLERSCSSLIFFTFISVFCSYMILFFLLFGCFFSFFFFLCVFRSFWSAVCSLVFKLWSLE